MTTKGADRVESENCSQIRETNNSNACFLADSRSKCDLFSFFSSHESTWPKIWKKCNFRKPQIVFFFPDSDSIISRIEFKRKKNLAIGFQPTYLNFEILFSHDFFCMNQSLWWYLLFSCVCRNPLPHNLRGCQTKKMRSLASKRMT